MERSRSNFRNPTIPREHDQHDKPATRPRKFVDVDEGILPFHLVTINLEGELNRIRLENAENITNEQLSSR
jgi:hypothetical protein